MKTILRAIIIGAIIWIIGVSLYSLSFYIPIIENAELQANLILTLAVIPLVWFGAKAYYKKGNNTNGLLVGLTFFLTAAFLDAVITVPYLIIPNGGSYKQFFTDLGFWLIGLEFIVIAALYWHLNISTRKQSNNLKQTL
jgi:hypothetical protein